MVEHDSTWPAPAKLNLMLRVVGRRQDGYHELQTVFQFVTLCDWLSFKTTDSADIYFASNRPDLNNQDNLVVRAARLLKQYRSTSAGANIFLAKNIPTGAGLGGGSSDAATTLIALNQLWRTGLSADELAQLGLGLGADVPIFIRGAASWAEGVGEKLQPLCLPEPWYLIIDPGVQVSTAEIFSAPELTRDAKPIKIRDFLDGLVDNTCLSTVTSRYPEVANALDWLDQKAQARLTGTGGCVFASFTERAQAETALSDLPELWRGFVTQGRNRSLLLDRLEAGVASV